MGELHGPEDWPYPFHSSSERQRTSWEDLATSLSSVSEGGGWPTKALPGFGSRAVLARRRRQRCRRGPRSWRSRLHPLPLPVFRDPGRRRRWGARCPRPLDAGNGGLVVRVEAFELISGFCDFFSNCEPSFRLQVDIDQDGVVDVTRRADFEDFLDAQPLIDPVSWTFDVPEDVQEVDLILIVFELDVFSGDDAIDIHPDPEFTAGWIQVQAPFLYVQFVSQGDQEPVGRITYSEEATGV